MAWRPGGSQGKLEGTLEEALKVSVGASIITNAILVVPFSKKAYYTPTPILIIKAPTTSARFQHEALEGQRVSDVTRLSLWWVGLGFGAGATGLHMGSIF